MASAVLEEAAATIDPEDPYLHMTSSEGDEEGPCPGGSTHVDLWPILWGRQSERLEDLSRAMAAELRHGAGRGTALLANKCAGLAGPDRYTLNDALLVAVSSRRKCGRRRFDVEEDEDGLWISAVAKITIPRAVWSHGPPPIAEAVTAPAPHQTAPPVSGTQGGKEPGRQDNIGGALRPGPRARRIPRARPFGSEQRPRQTRQDLSAPRRKLRRPAQAETEGRQG